jgi:hypothetical protein
VAEFAIAASAQKSDSSLPPKLDVEINHHRPLVHEPNQQQQARLAPTNQSLLSVLPKTPSTLPKLLERSANAKKCLPLARTTVGHSLTPPAAAAPPGNSIILCTTDIRYGYCLGLKLRHCDLEDGLRHDTLVLAKAQINCMCGDAENQHNVTLGNLWDKIQAYILEIVGPCHEPPAESAIAIAFGFGAGVTNMPVQLWLYVLSLNHRYCRRYADPQQCFATVATATFQRMLAEASHMLKTMSQEQHNQLWHNIEEYVREQHIAVCALCSRLVRSNDHKATKIKIQIL